MAPRRDLPTLQEAARILTAKRTRPQRRPPPPMGRALNKTLKALDAKFGQGSGALEARWREVVGVEIAKRTEPVKLTRGRNGGPSSLEIRVAGPAAAIIQGRPGGNTRETISAMARLEVDELLGPWIAVSTPFHARRIRDEARRAGIDVVVSGPQA